MTIAFLLILPQLIAAGISTEQEVETMIKLIQPGMTDAELNAILQALGASAAKHKAIAEADAGRTAV